MLRLKRVLIFFYPLKNLILIKNPKAFSLIEVLASILLMAGLVSIVAQLSYGNSRRIKKARQLEKIAHLLEIKMLQLEEEFKGKNMINLPEEAEGEFEGEKSYFWAYKTQALALPPPDILLSLAKIPSNELNAKMAQMLTEVLLETVVELKLTVYHKRKRGKEFKYSLVSYFINYEDAPDFVSNRLIELLPAEAEI